MENTNESIEHQKLIEAMIAMYKNNGWTVLQAADDNYPKPETIGRHAPDIIVQQSDGLYRICEAESGKDGFKDQTTIEQLQDFSNLRMAAGLRKGETVPFDIVIPKEMEEQLRTVLKENSLSSRKNIII